MNCSELFDLYHPFGFILFYLFILLNLVIWVDFGIRGTWNFNKFNRLEFLIGPGADVTWLNAILLPRVSFMVKLILDQSSPLPPPPKQLMLVVPLVLRSSTVIKFEVYGSKVHKMFSAWLSLLSVWINFSVELRNWGTCQWVFACPNYLACKFICKFCNLETITSHLCACESQPWARLLVGWDGC